MGGGELSYLFPISVVGTMPRGSEVPMKVANSTLRASSKGKATRWTEELGCVIKNGPVEHDPISGPQVPLYDSCHR